MATTLTAQGFNVGTLLPYVPAGLASQASLQAAQDALTALQATVAAQQQTLTNTVTPTLQALRSSSTAHTVGAGGLTTVNFTKVFDDFPSVGCTRIEASDTAGAIDFSVKSWIQDGNGKYTGAIIRAKRQQLLPSSLVLLTALQSFDIFGGSAVGASFTCDAIQRTA